MSNRRTHFACSALTLTTLLSLAFPASAAAVDCDTRTRGFWWGRAFTDIRVEDEDLYRRWITDENCRCPDGESHADVRSRMMRAFERVNSERAVLVAHGTANRIGATALLNLPLMSAMRLAQDNAAMNVFVQRGDHWILKVWNHT